MLDTRHFVVRTLLAEGQVREQDVRRAQEHAVASGIDLLDAMVGLGVVTSRKLAIARAKICEYPFVDLTHYDIDIQNARLLPRPLAERFTAFPLFVVGGVATVAMLDPLNLHAIDQVRQQLKMDVDPVLADADHLRALISRAYSLAQHSETEDTDTQPEATASLTTGDEPIVAAVNQVIAGAVDAGASDIHINPDEHDLHLRYRIDGQLAPQQGPPRSVHAGLVQRLKVLARLDLTQTRRPQDGKFRFQRGAQSVDIRLSLMPTVHGENVVMRLLSSASRIGDVASLGMPTDIAGWYDELIRRPHGLMLVTGPTGSGKTTTLYTALNAINSPDRNIMTIEDPVEIRLPLVRQIQVNTEIGLTFASALRSVLRQDPDVILVGEIRDQETARIAVQSALTGHMVFSTLHTNDSVGAVARLRDLELPAFAINNALLAAIAQRLVRKVCTDCRGPETDHDLVARWQPMRPGASFIRGAGCARCLRTGFKGRLGVYEMFRVTARTQALIEANAVRGELERAAALDGMRLIWEDGLDKAARGITSLGEIARLRGVIESDDVRRLAA